MIGTLFDLKSFTIHDGPGVRTTVFLKGCPLRCIWCHNPEGLSMVPQLMVKTTLCKACGLCYQPCSHKECQPYKRCLKICPDGLLTLTGYTTDSTELAEKILKNEEFLRLSGGGVTFSGGEPLLQSEFVIDVIKKLKGLHIAIETSGHAETAVFQLIVNAVDYVIMDVKLADAKQHFQFTGVDNNMILQNLKYLKNSKTPYLLRMPMIPDITDKAENMNAIKEMIEDSPIEFIPYNKMSEAKYLMLNMPFPYKIYEENL